MINLLFIENEDVLDSTSPISKTLVRSVGIVRGTKKRNFCFSGDIKAEEGAPFYCDAIAFECSEPIEIEVMIYGA